VRVLIAIGVPRQKEGGAAGVVLNHARELTRRGHEVECWFLEDVLKRPTRAARFQALLFAIGTANRILKNRGKYDVVNIHAPWGCVYGVWKKLFRPKGAPPYVMTMQGSEQRFVEAMREEDRKGRATNFGWKNRAWHRVYHQIMYEGSIKTADFGVVANAEGRLYAERMCQGAEGRFRFLPNGVEESFFQPREYGERKPVRLLYVGTWLDRKGVFYLSEAFRIAAKRVADLRLTVAGCALGEERVRGFFAPEIRARVDAKPFVSREEMPAVYAAHDIFILASLAEGMPLSLLEAMAAGTPAVTTKIGGAEDLISDGTNGLLVPQADAEGLAEAIERLARSVELRERLGRAAQDKVRGQTWAHVARELEKIFMLAAATLQTQREAAVSRSTEQHQGEGG
jgi:glycosyltransferase involved in cell wall biosynthesis